jgi:nitrite reductase/ring-hydroxylating ferredoxin subunit
MPPTTLHRTFFQRLFGRCATGLPVDETCWSYGEGHVQIDLARALELGSEGGAFRLEGKGLPDRLLVFHGVDGELHAVRNRCTHGKRRLDPVPGEAHVQCCSIGKSTFDYDGHRISGSAKKDLEFLSLSVEGNSLRISL